METTRKSYEELNANDDNLIRNLDKLAYAYPWNTQKMQLIEEMGELLQALSKYERANGDGQPTKVTPEAAMKNLIEELAGVQVMLIELITILEVEDEVEAEMLSQTERAMRILNNQPKTYKVQDSVNKAAVETLKASLRRHKK